MRFDNEQQYNNIWDTAIARKIKLVDESIDALNKLSTFLPQVKYNNQLLLCHFQVYLVKVKFNFVTMKVNLVKVQMNY